MFGTWYHKWVNRNRLVGLGRGQTSARRKSSRPLRLEALENRLVPATHVWSGAVNNLWSIPGNWSGGAPAANEANVIIQFPFPDAKTQNSTNDIPNLIVHELDFIGAGYTIGGDTITLLGNTTVTNNGTNTINLGLDLAAGAFFSSDHVFLLSAGSALNLNGQIRSPAINLFDLRGAGILVLSNGANSYEGITLINGQATLRLGADDAIPASTLVNLTNAGATLDVNSHSDVLGGLSGVSGSLVTLGSRGSINIGALNPTTTFSGIISGGGLSGIPVDVQGGTLTLAGPNTYGQPGSINFTVIVVGATLKVGNDKALPSSSSLLVGGTLDCNNFNPRIGSLEGTVGTVNTRRGSLTTGANNRSTDFGGTLSGSGPLFKVGSGTQTLSGFSTNSFIINIDGGTVLNNGFHPNYGFNVGSSGTLAGFDTIGSADVGNSPAGGTLSPGSSSGPGRLSTSFGVFFNLPSTFRVRLNGTTPGSQFDQLIAGGPVNLANQPTLDVSLGFPAQIGDSFTIITAAKGVTGHFQGLTNGTFFTVGGARFQIHYTSTSVVLTRVPGPATQYLVSATSTSQAGSRFDVTVTALDPNNNIVNGYGGTVHFTTSDPSGGTLPADYTFTPDDQGVHTFAGGSTLFTAGDQTITVTDAITGVSTSATVTVTPAPAVAFTIAAPASSPSGSPFDITVTAQDPYGNTDTNYQGTVTFSSSDTDPGVVLPADYTFQAIDSGSVTFAGGGTLITPGDQTLAATDTVSGITGSAVVTVGDGLQAPPGNRPGGPGAHLPLVVGAVPGAAAPAAETIGSPLPGTEKTLPAPLDAGAVDGFFASTQQDAHSLAAIRTNHNALSWANDGFWDGVSDEVPAVV